MKSLTKEETKKLEYTTTPIYSYVHFLDEKYLHKFYDIIGWYHHHNISCNNKKEIKAKLIEILGKPLYYITHRHKNMVWGFNICDNKVVIYKDKRGLSIQCLTDNNIDKVISILYNKMIPLD